MLDSRVQRIFILSPAKTAGQRASMLFSPQARFPLASRLREEGLPLWELFSFLSGLYFRGKYAYAKAFARPPKHLPGVLVITSKTAPLS
jgi:hypothetical protein